MKQALAIMVILLEGTWALGAETSSTATPAGTAGTFAGIGFVYCPPGTFMMGRYPDEQDSNPWEGPQHEVTLTQGFWMSKYEVTQSQWKAVMGSNPSYYQGADKGNRPVERVSWDDIASSGGFLEKLDAAYPMYTFRLPTEAEWEYACRAGTTTRFYWGDDPSYTLIWNSAWYWFSGGGAGTEDVGGKSPNAWGLYDMNGNVWEWCQDWYGNYTADPVSDPDGPSTGSTKVMRAGAWLSYGFECRSAVRGNWVPCGRGGDVGFRIVRSMQAGTSIYAPADPACVGEGEGEGEGEGDLTVMLPGNTPLVLVHISAGTFMMGRYPGEQDSLSWEDPQHQVTLTEGFWMSKYETTQAQWKAVMGSNPSFFNGEHVGGANTDNRPVEQVSWNDIAAQGGFLEKLNNAQSMYTFDLPTEAQWEYACRAGTTTRFYWGDDPGYSQTGLYAWYWRNSSLVGTQDVGKKLPNAWGLYDMSGNVWEWCRDYYSSYTANPVSDPEDPSTGLAPIIRGGAWLGYGYGTRSALRGSWGGGASDCPGGECRGGDVGFRLVLTVLSAQPVAAFGATPVSGVDPLEVQFVDYSAPGDTLITNWTWSFGDGATSLKQSPAHTYDKPGTYTVSLTVTTENGSSSEVKTNFITVDSPGCFGATISHKTGRGLWCGDAILFALTTLLLAALGRERRTFHAT